MHRRRRLTRAAQLAFCLGPALLSAAPSRPARAQVAPPAQPPRPAPAAQPPARPQAQPQPAPATQPPAQPQPAPPQPSPPPPPPAPPPLEVVVTGTRTPESSQRATVRTRVISREEAERRGATNVAEALDGELGVQVNSSAYGALGNPSAIQIQGFDLDRVLVLEDGERVIGDSGGAIDLSSLPLSDVSRIELVTGPTSSLYGASAIGGVVNVLSAPPAHPGFSGRGRVEGRSRAGLLVQTSGAYRGERAWASADASFQREDSLTLLEDSAATALPERAQHLVGLRAGAALGRGIDVRLRARWIHDEQDGIEQPPPLPGLGVYRIDVPEVTDRFTLHLTETLDLGGGSSLRLAAGRQWAYRTSERNLRGSPRSELRDRTGSLQSYEAIATIAQGRLTWVAGARAEVESLTQELERTDVSTSGIFESTLDEVPDTELGSAAVYGQLAWKLTDSLTLMPGVRGEYWPRYGAVLAPRLALAYRPAPSLTLRISGGRGFRAPSAKELGFSFDHSGLGYKLEGNPELAPETSWGANGDVTWIPREGLTVRAGAFANWVDDLIDFDPKPIDTSGGVDTYTYMNVAKARTAGVELSATFQAASWLRADAGYAYLWTRDDTGDRPQPLSGKPPHTAQAALRADLPFQLELVARLRTIASAFIEVDDRGVTRRAPGFTTLDARLARPLWPSSQAYVGVRNLLGAQKDPNRRNDHRPLEGRTVYLGVVAELPWEDS
ncbi:TonB-dependent receptor plug domain-containing protein [Sorangium sp. So ce385]|uniref:TonB-dependent receptor plug domain-containing protein n=1 Tax=Sorangium sp. So ce385 TaxID=3133308 RepID=UPI003F5B3D7F